MDWERYTGKKCSPVETRGPLNEVVVEKQRDGEWQIIAGEDLGELIIGTIPPRPVLKWEDVKVTPFTKEGFDRIRESMLSKDESEPLPSFDEVWETIAGEIDKVQLGTRLQRADEIVRAMRIAMRIMYETLTAGTER